MSEIDINSKFETLQSLAISEPTHGNMQRYLLVAIYKYIPTLKNNDIYAMKWFKDGVKAPYIKLDDKTLKMKSGLEIPLSDDLVDIFKTVKEFIESDYVFANLNNYKKCRSSSGHTRFMNGIFGEHISSRKITRDYITKLFKDGETMENIIKKTGLTRNQVLGGVRFDELITR